MATRRPVTNVQLAGDFKIKVKVEARVTALRCRPARVSISSACVCVSEKGCVLIQPQQKRVAASSQPATCCLFTVFVTHTH